MAKDRGALETNKGKIKGREWHIEMNKRELEKTK